MKSFRDCSRPFWLFMCGMFICLSEAPAQWSTDPAQNLQILSNSIKPKIVSDGEGGVIVVGESFTVNPLLYAQRVDKYGNILWDPTLRGIRVTTPGDEQSEAVVVSDGAGGAYVGFNALKIVGYSEEPPEPIYSSFARIQRFDSQGTRLFGPEGIILYDYPVDTLRGRQGIYYLVPDSEGGVYVMWGDFYGPQGNDRYINHVTSDGRISWENSPFMNAPFSIKENFLIYPDGEDGLIVYHRFDDNLSRDSFIRINKDGHILIDKPIDTGLTPFCLFSAQDGECILLWQDFNQFSQLDTIRCQKINRNGENLWGERPVIIDSAGQLANPLGVGRMPDDAGGAFFAFRKASPFSSLIYLDPEGKVIFKKHLERFNGMGWNLQECLLPTQKKGVLYNVYRPNEGQYICALDSTGNELWPKVLYTNREVHADWDGMVTDGNGGAIMVWFEILPSRGIWAQQVSGSGKLGIVTSVKHPPDRNVLPENFALFPAYPNPFNGTVRLQYQTPKDEMIFVKVYDLSGKEVITLVKQQLIQGKHEVIWDGRDQFGRLVSSGVYFYQLSIGTQRHVRKIMVLH